VNEPSAGDVMVGVAVGAVLATVKKINRPGVVLPAVSVDTALMICCPSARGYVIVHVPPPVAVVISSSMAPSNTCTVVPASVVPLIGTGLALVNEPSAGDVTNGNAGGVLSTVKVLAVLVGLLPMYH
jgi:hypothetical protein